MEKAADTALVQFAHTPAKGSEDGAELQRINMFGVAPPSPPTDGAPSPQASGHAYTKSLSSLGACRSKSSPRVEL